MKEYLISTPIKSQLKLLPCWYPIGYHKYMTVQTLNPDSTGSILKQARLNAQLSLRELAMRAGTSHATLLAYENGKKTPGVHTFYKILEACGYSVQLQLQKRIREQNGIKRRDELAAVLKLAEHFPARHARTINFPVLIQ